MRSLTALLLLSVLGTAACYRTTITSGHPSGRIPVQYEQRWHHGFVMGIVEVDGDYMLDEICPEGWSVIKTKTTFLNGLIQAVAGAYNPQTLQIQCAQAPPAGP